MSGHDSKLQEFNIKKIIQDLTESLLKIEITNENIDEFFKLESILKTNEDEFRLKKQLISKKIRSYYTTKYLDQYKKTFEELTPYPLIYSPVLNSSARKIEDLP